MSDPQQVRLSTGFTVPLDGDLLAIIEALYKEITLGEALGSSFETMRSEILSLIDQMSDADRRAYLAESLFLNSVTYENEMLSAYVRRLGMKTTAPAPRPVKKTKSAAPSKKATSAPKTASKTARKTAAKKTGKKKTR